MVAVNVQNPVMPTATAPSPFYAEEHEAFRDMVRRFVDKEITPYVDQWDEAEEFPRELYRKASAAGLLFAEPLKAAGPPPVEVTPALIEAAKKEGKLSYYSALELNTAERLARTFEAAREPIVTACPATERRTESEALSRCSTTTGCPGIKRCCSTNRRNSGS